MRTLLLLFAIVGTLLIAGLVAIELASIDPATSQQLENARTLLKSISWHAWTFARPLVQLVVVLLILDWLFSRAGIRLHLNEFNAWSVQTFIAGPHHYHVLCRHIGWH